MKKNYCSRVHGICTLLLAVWIALNAIDANAQTPNTTAGKDLAASKNKYGAGDASKYHSSTVGLPTGQAGFYENKGQITDQNQKPNAAVKYLLSSPGFNVQLRQTGFSYDTYTDIPDETTDVAKSIAFPKGKGELPKTFTRKYHRVDIELPGCNPNAAIVTEGKSDAYYNYLTAGTPQGGISNVHYYEKVIYKNIYPNIDLEFFTKDNRSVDRSVKTHDDITHDDKGGTGVEYNFIVHPGGNPADIKLAYKGANKVRLEDDKLVVNVAAGDFSENIPNSYLRDNPTANIKVSYAALGNNVFTFALPSGMGTLASDLIIDPTPNLNWATYYGGGNEEGFGVATDASGNVYITGWTQSTSGIATSGAYQTTLAGGYDACLAKFNSSGAIQWATYYGGSSYDYVYGVATDASGNVYITGYTYSSSGIATSGAYQTTYAGGIDAFLAKFNSSGAIQWATYYGGSGDDAGYGVATDASGNVYITGSTKSTSGIATSGAYQTTLGG